MKLKKQVYRNIYIADVQQLLARTIDAVVLKTRKNAMINVTKITSTKIVLINQFHKLVYFYLDVNRLDNMLIYIKVKFLKKIYDYEFN